MMSPYSPRARISLAALRLLLPDPLESESGLIGGLGLDSESDLSSSESWAIPEVLTLLRFDGAGPDADVPAMMGSGNGDWAIVRCIASCNAVMRAFGSLPILRNARCNR